MDALLWHADGPQRRSATCLANEPFNDWAAAQTDHEPMHGRGINYGVMLPAGSNPGASTPVVVRRKPARGAAWITYWRAFSCADTRAPRTGETRCDSLLQGSTPRR